MHRLNDWVIERLKCVDRIDVHMDQACQPIEKKTTKNHKYFLWMKRDWVCFHFNWNNLSETNSLNQVGINKINCKDNQWKIFFYNRDTDQFRKNSIKIPKYLFRVYELHTMQCTNVHTDLLFSERALLSFFLFHLSYFPISLYKIIIQWTVIG